MADRSLAALLTCGVLAACSACTSVLPGTAAPLSVTDVERTRVGEYFDRLNEAGAAGPGPQRELLARTQHPDHREHACTLGEATLRMTPTMSTLRGDADWVPPGERGHPRGVVLAVAVTVTVVRDSQELGSQIGTVHVVVLDGTAYGFAPCVTG
ncbi:hypothetical protein [Umezawaea beigongshangensis]|uniref:hypothetical protein n=1 Tax=Umezawaea beigongshangensis TaxID=2780383 RepID=UPI0027DC9D8C|nr:hypothetical protein [Umezawaea beigongshangensis]